STLQRVEFDTTSKARTVQRFLNEVRVDLGFMRQSNAVRNLFRHQSEPESAALQASRKEAEREFKAFFQGDRSYCNVQCFGGKGSGLIRLVSRDRYLVALPFNSNAGSTVIASIKGIASLKPGQIFMFPIQRENVHGMPNMPPQGVVRYATPVLSVRGEFQGFLMIGICMRHLLATIGALPAGSEAWLLEQDGTYLGYVGDSEEEMKVFSSDPGRKLEDDFTPGQSRRILDGLEGGVSLETPKALLSSAAISLGPEAGNRKWLLMVSRPRSTVEIPVRQLMESMTLVLAIVVICALVFGFFMAFYLSRPVARLREATREIAAGNLSKRVEITTGDEIEALAEDFNAMAEKLGHAQARLSEWNRALEEEVARKTENLHRLQNGLARTDKLASIGQMTAGVMHEIGNPLAAIKTKIQVAEQEGLICSHCKVLLDELNREVNRLSNVLRSFSRLSRLHAPLAEAVDLNQVVQDVVSLISPEMRRRGLRLLPELDPGVPSVRGNGDQFRQLLVNLVLNAAEASSREKEIRIGVSSGEGEGGDGSGILRVEDQGVGMSEETLQKIWDPFFTTRPDGTGLGLSICRKIASDHGGRISVSSRSGEGTIVTVSIPFWNPEAPGLSSTG
ncbi:MAG: PAS domain-containing sensor histidine kinase, partial [Planctomycetota bacterium]